MERYSTVCEEGIDLLMDIFYAKIRADKTAWETSLTIRLAPATKNGRSTRKRLASSGGECCWEQAAFRETP